MAKTKRIWICGECGDQQSRWLGQCLSCHSWNTYQEELNLPSTPSRYQSKPKETRPIRLNEVSISDTPRMATGVSEFDRLVGGGIVPGSFTLVGGAPGIGKSTLLLQISNVLAKQGKQVLYVCGEESVEQTSLRARRLGIDSPNLLLFSETDFGRIQSQIEQLQPSIVIVDSIQIIYKEDIPSAPGSVTQVRETASSLMHLAKGLNISIFVVGHVTKSGEIAGPRVLEHLVDTVLYFEGDQQHHYRMMRVVKNRFGPTDEVAVFRMLGNGLAEVPNPSDLFLEERSKGVVGTAILPTLEGTRPILVEVQALVTKTAYATPSRRATGISSNRLALLLAVLEKRAGFALHSCDVFVSVAGGLKISEPAIDLGVILSIASSLCDQVIPPDTLLVGEVGLGGEIRSVPRIDSRIKEAANMGFSRCILPKRSLKGIPKELCGNIQLVGVDRLEEAIHALIR